MVTLSHHQLRREMKGKHTHTQRNCVKLVMVSCLVFKLDCDECDECYIRQTSRRLNKHIHERKSKEFSSF